MPMASIPFDQDYVVGGEEIRRFDLTWEIVSAPMPGLTDDAGFIPIPGAAGYQVGNPSALALTAVLASLEIFQMTTMTALRTKSIKLTGYLERLLREGNEGFYQIITPTNPAERGAQLSILLQSGLLDGVMVSLEESGIVVDERKPDVIRVAPAPLYNTFEEVCFFVLEFQAACKKAKQHRIIRGAEADSFLEAG